MADNLEGQGTVIPTMHLGLGGIGSRIVDQIAGRAARLPLWESRLRGLTTFVCLDTNILDLNRLRNVPQGSRIHIGAFDKRKVVENYRKSLYQQALQWIDKNYQPREGIKEGAGQIRVESRLGYFYSSPQIRGKLSDLIRFTLDPNNNWRQNNPPKYFVYVYCSLAGGTGSGAFLPVAYLVQDLLVSQGWQPRVIGNLALSTLLTHRVAADLHPNIHANTYAALKELEHLEKMNYKTVKQERPNGEPFVFWNDEQAMQIPHVRSGPFFHTFLFDRPANFDVDEVEVTIADACFAQLFTPIIDSVASEYDNYEQHLQSLTQFPGENRYVGQGYTKNCGAFGTAGLVLPAADLLDYCALRFAAEALRRQITFGSGGASSADERERALDQHRINYNDPEFRELDEPARFERINKSFVNCVRTMADFDGKAGRKEGYWFRLVEEVDKGDFKGMDAKGVEIRSETLTARVLRLLDEDRKKVIDELNIKSPTFVFTREAVNQYQELLNKFKTSVHDATRMVESGKERLRASAKAGDVIASLRPRPTPMQERYLLLQLLTQVDTKLLPEALEQAEKSKGKALTGPGVQERLEKELPASLNDAAQARPWHRMGYDEEAFVAVRNGAQDEVRDAGRAQTKFFDADVKLAQYQALRDYLTGRARQFAILSTRMNDAVRELESDAESVRTGVGAKEPRLQMAIEVFETLAQPRRRIWDEVYEELFVRDGRDLATFDRQILAAAIAAQLEPVKNERTGRLEEKEEYKLVADLKRALTDLGRQRMHKTIFGDQDQRGLTLESALEIEARLLLPKRPGRSLEEAEIHAYMDKKFRAVHLLAAPIARTKTEEMRSLGDGVKVANKRHFVIDRGTVSPRFFDAFKNVLAEASRSGRQLSDANLDNPYLALVHDVELPIPMYYFEAVNGEIEDAYMKVMANERRSFHIHTDFKWEHALPDLNPAKAEINITWSLEILADGLLTKVVAADGGNWVWRRTEKDVEALGPTLASALYTLASLHDDEILGPRLKKAITETRDILGAEQMHLRSSLLRDWVANSLEEIAIRARRHEMTPGDDLEKPVLRALEAILSKRLAAGPVTQSGGSGSGAGATATQTTSMGF